MYLLNRQYYALRCFVGGRAYLRTSRNKCTYNDLDDIAAGSGLVTNLQLLHPSNTDNDRSDYTVNRSSPRALRIQSQNDMSDATYMTKATA